MAGKFLADEITFKGSIPLDLQSEGIRGRTVNLYQPLEAREVETGQELDNNGILKRVLSNSDIDLMLRTIGNAFFPRSIIVGTTPSLIIAPNRQPKGYILINPNASVSGIVTSGTLLPSAAYAAGTTNTTPLTVGGFRSARFFLNITGAGGTVTIDAQSQDPVTGNWATTQSDIFLSTSGIGTYYAIVGDIGVDQFLRLAVTVTGAAVTMSIGYILKEAYGAAVAGSALFIGGDSVNTTIGFPILSGQREVFYLRENTPIYGIAVAPLQINLFELQ